MGSITPERLSTPVIADTYPTNHECNHWPVEYVFVPDGVDLGIHEPRGRENGKRTQLRLPTASISKC